MIEAMKQALEALQEVYWSSRSAKHDEAITSLRQAIEQAEKQEPKFWEMPDGKIVDKWGLQFYRNDIGTNLYTTSPAASVQEPSIPEGWERKTVIGFDALVEALDYAERKGFMPDYIADAWEGFNYFVDEKHTSPAPQRTWVGLTDTDIGDEYVRFQIQGGFNRFEYAVRAIEAKLKEKNT